MTRPHITDAQIDALIDQHVGALATYETIRRVVRAAEAGSRQLDGTEPTALDALQLELASAIEERDHLRKVLAASGQASISEDASRIAEDVCRAIAELPDRNSPEDWPDAMLVTHAELTEIVRDAIRGKGE